MRKAMIYPFSARCLPLTLYFSKFQPEYSISALVSPVGLGLFGRTPFTQPIALAKVIACAM